MILEFKYTNHNELVNLLNELYDLFDDIAVGFSETESNVIQVKPCKPISKKVVNYFKPKSSNHKEPFVLPTNLYDGFKSEFYHIQRMLLRVKED